MLQDRRRELALRASSRKEMARSATAESCTGGLLAKMLTDIAGSSAYFRQGWITYSNEAKTNLLGVPRKRSSTTARSASKRSSRDGRAAR